MFKIRMDRNQNKIVCDIGAVLKAKFFKSKHILKPIIKDLINILHTTCICDRYLSFKPIAVSSEVTGIQDA